MLNILFLILKIITKQMSQLIQGLESVTDITPETIEAIRCYRKLRNKIENVLSTSPENTKIRLTELYKSLNITNAIQNYNDNINKITQFVRARDYLAQEMSKISVDSNIMQELLDIRESINLDNAENIFDLTPKQLKKYENTMLMIKKELANPELLHCYLVTLLKYEINISLANSIVLSKEIKTFIHDALTNTKYVKLRKSCTDAIECAKKDNILSTTDNNYINYHLATLDELKNNNARMGIWSDTILDKINKIRDEKKEETFYFSVITYLVAIVLISSIFIVIFFKVK